MFYYAGRWLNGWSCTGLLRSRRVSGSSTPSFDEILHHNASFIFSRISRRRGSSRVARQRRFNVLNGMASPHGQYTTAGFTHLNRSRSLVAIFALAHKPVHHVSVERSTAAAIVIDCRRLPQATPGRHTAQPQRRADSSRLLRRNS